MKKINITLLLVVLLLSNICFSQNNKGGNDLKKNSVYFELGGNTGSYSINYDYIFFKKNSSNLIGRLGFSIIPSNTCPLIVPLEINALNGSGIHHLEYGVGFSPIFYIGQNKEESSSIALVRIGYRYQKYDGGTIFRAAFTPIIKNAEDSFGEFRFTPWIGISIGRNF